MMKAYRSTWLKLHSKYENKARIIFQNEFKAIARNIPFETMDLENYEVFTSFYIERKDVFNAYLKVYTEIGGNHGKRVGAEINKQINEKNFNITSFLNEFQNTLINWLNQFGGQRIVSVRQNYISYINELIAQGIADGKTIAIIATDLTKMINSRNFYRWQSLRIARTETTTASNYAATVASSVSGVLMDKIWISAQDKRTRRPPDSKFDHFNMNGTRVPLDKPFNVGGELIMFAGAPTNVNGTQTSGGNVINCRCVNAQLVRRDKDGKIMRV